MTSAPAAPASIIVPCFGQLEFTRHCVAALARRTRPPFELIAIDNGSPDGTAAYLAGVADAAAFPVRVISNPENRGFPAAVNQGLAAAEGEYLVLLNNDAVVTDGWLEQLIALADSAPSIGLAGPTSNYASPPQLVADVPYRDLAGMHAFAARRRAEHRGRWQTAAKLSGFCLLMRRAVLEAVGGLDERFGLGLFDDDDLAERARAAGFELAVARDCFVHHFGSRTFAGSGIDAGALLAANAAKFAAKWGADSLRGRSRAALSPWSPSAPAEPAGPRPRVSLTMIVRDEEGNLPACLESARDLFDEVVVVDTGSTDRTGEIARSFGARVFDFVWVDDFAAARNAALARATGDYAFWLDADDVLDPPERENLRALLAGLRSGDEAAYVVRCLCDDGPGGGRTAVDHVRLFPLREDVRWDYAVHEQILPAVRKAGLPVRWTGATVRHTGYADPAVRARKLVRDEAILGRELADRPGDPFVRFNLGFIAVERGDWAAALPHLGASLAGSSPSDSIVAKLHALTARCHQGLGDPAAAIAACAAGREAAPEDAELLFREAVVRRQAGDAAGAEGLWRRVLAARPPERFRSLDMGIHGHLTRRNLAALAEERGDGAEARRLWGEVLAECPGDREATARLARPAGPPPAVAWLIPGSRRELAPAIGPGDFDPYLAAAAAWVAALDARVVVELGVRAGSSARALLEGVKRTGGRVWGVDPVDGHGIDDPAFTFVASDAAACADLWPAIDLLHVDTDPHTEEQTRLWLDLYAGRCRAIALHDAHHPDFGVGRAVRAFVEGRPGVWDAYEYWGNPSGWTVLARRGEPAPPPGRGLVAGEEAP